MELNLNFMNREGQLKIQSYEFGVRIVKIAIRLKRENREYELASQLIKSGTAVGAMICEAEFAESNRDYLHKFTVALKEMNECRYWLKLLNDVEILEREIFSDIYFKSDNIFKMLIATIKTIKQKMSKP